MKNRKKVIFVQGFGDYTSGVWPNWLGQELTKAGFDFYYLNMPGVMCPEVHEWVDFLKEQKFRVNKDTYFVGHSLGCITLARYLETLPARSVAGGCIMVAGFCSLPKVPLLVNFCDLPLDFSKVKKHAREFVMVVSDNDHLIPRASSDELAEKLKTRIIEESGKGHFMADVKELPSVLNCILEMNQMREEEREIRRLERFK